MIIFVFVFFMMLMIYLLIRNLWVYRRRKEMIEEIHKYNKILIDNGTYDKMSRSYDEMPGYGYMLFCRFYKWNKDYFDKYANEKKRVNEKSII